MRSQNRYEFSRQNTLEKHNALDLYVYTNILNLSYAFRIVNSEYAKQFMHGAIIARTLIEVKTHPELVCIIRHTHTHTDTQYTHAYPFIWVNSWESSTTSRTLRLQFKYYQIILIIFTCVSDLHITILDIPFNENRI